jgi:hypothetical protein
MPLRKLSSTPRLLAINLRPRRATLQKVGEFQQEAGQNPGFLVGKRSNIPRCCF